MLLCERAVGLRPEERPLGIELSDNHLAIPLRLRSHGNPAEHSACGVAHDMDVMRALRGGVREDSVACGVELGDEGCVRRWAHLAYTADRQRSRACSAH